MNVKNLALPYHQASATTLDGAAVVQMILESIGSVPPPSQSAIDSEISLHNIEDSLWFSDPAGVKGALMALKPSTFGNIFVTHSFATEAESSRKLTYTIHKYSVAPAALVYGGGHWLAVKGVSTDVDPLDNSTYTIHGFWLHNPWPGDPYPTSPSENVWVDYAAWQSTYASPVGFGAQWAAKYVSVNDPEALLPGELLPPKRRSRHVGDRLVSPNKVAELVHTEAQELGLDADPHLKAILTDGTAAEPLLVQTANRSHYYLQPWLNGKDVTGTFRLDAQTGLLREAGHFERATRWPALTRDQLIDRLENDGLQVAVPAWTSPISSRAGRLTIPELTLSPRLARLGTFVPRLNAPRRLYHPGKLKQVELHPRTWCLQEALFWIPCWESRSPAYPFYVVASGDRLYFVGTLDGVAYESLHPFTPASVPGGGV